MLMMPAGRPHCKLNDYQQLMLKISRLTPYNAVHAVKLKPQQADISTLHMALELAINESLQTLGLGLPIFSDAHQDLSFHSEVQNCFLNTKNMLLQAHVNIEMNKAFQQDELPLRFFLLASEHDHYLSITYNHWIVDAYGISRLIEVIFGHASGDMVRPLSLSAPNMKACFPKIYGNLAPFYRLFTVLSSALRFCSAYRPLINNIECTESGNSAYIFEPDVILGLSKYCKQAKISLNDLFVAILAQLFGDVSHMERMHSHQKRFKAKRDQIVIAVISNIRQQSRLCLDHVFSLFLGFFYLSFKSPEGQTLQDLSQDIHLKTKYLKKSSAALKHSLLFKVQNWFWDNKKNDHAKYRLFNKNTPITLGISNMDMRHLSPLLQPSIEQYIRFSPTAMVCPLVFNLSTFNQYLSLGISFRKACYSDEAVAQIQARFVTAIHELIAESYFS